MKRFSALLIVFIFLLQIGYAGAVYIPESQQKFTVVIEQGDEYKFPLVIQNIEETKDVSSSGEISAWMGFGKDNENNYTIYPSIITILPVTISVQNNTEIGEYTGSIKAGNEIISDITVKVTLPVSDVRVLQKFSDIDKKVESLKYQVQKISENITGEINLTEETLLEKIAALKRYEEDIAKLEKERSELQKTIDYLENREIGFTGQMAGGISTIGFIIGLIVGIIVTFLFIKREEVHRKITRGSF